MIMSTFHLQIVTPDRKAYDGEAEKLIVRAVNGDVCILPHHIDYAVPLGIGEAKVTTADGTEREGVCNGGLLSVENNTVRVIATTFEWAEDIDVERAKRAQSLAEEQLRKLNREDADYALAEAKLKRAMARVQAGR